MRLTSMWLPTMFVGLALLVTAPFVFGHPGHVQETSGLLAGFLHPLLGMDHLLALAAIGIWAASGPAPLGRTVPVWAIVGILAGFIIARSGVPLPFTEVGITASTILALLLAALLVRISSPILLAGVVAGFLFFHGSAHGMEMPPGASSSLYAIGLAGSSALVIQASLWGARALFARGRSWNAGLGLGVASAASIPLIL